MINLVISTRTRVANGGATPRQRSSYLHSYQKKITDDVIVMGFVAFHLSSNNHLSYEVSLCLDLKCSNNYDYQPRLKLYMHRYSTL